ncbi:MAG: cobyrinate a,c-diamide synthase [Elainellaceae cyanobacterium]
MVLVIAGERSGVGKTTVTLALLAYLRFSSTLSKSAKIQSFKVGPDYIDPMFHRHVTGQPCRNLDPVLTSEDYVRQCYETHQHAADFALIEGVMGLFDGASGEHDWASTAHIARLLDVPILLVLDCSRLSRSIAALVHGYTTFDRRLKFAGIILNRVGSDRHLDLLKSSLASQPQPLPILGILRRRDDITLPSRHLGLIPTDELSELDTRIRQLATLAETWFDWSSLLPQLSTQTPPYSPSFPHPLIPSSPHPSSPSSPPPLPHSLKLAVAYDPAFNFYYADNFDLLIQLGAELVFWSPLCDQDLPDGISGLYLGGGFPEMFAAQLASNHAAKEAVKLAVNNGMPTYAECGGLMYLCDRLIDFSEQAWSMVGVISLSVRMGKRLTLGYRRAVACHDTPLLIRGDDVWGHEFHRSVLETDSPHPVYEMRGYDAQMAARLDGWRSHQLHASYVHLHWGSRPDIPTRFLQACREFAQRQTGSS